MGSEQHITYGLLCKILWLGEWRSPAGAGDGTGRTPRRPRAAGPRHFWGTRHRGREMPVPLSHPRPGSPGRVPSLHPALLHSWDAPRNKPAELSGSVPRSDSELF